MSNNTTTVFPFLPILTLIFITLKLTGYITWSWWWVLSPLWIGIGVVVAILTIVFIFLLVKSVIEACNL